MFCRCASVRAACAALIEAISAWYASEPTGAGDGTLTSVGAPRTIIFQLPAPASTADGEAWGRSPCVGTAALLQASEPAQTRAAAASASRGDLIGSPRPR